MKAQVDLRIKRASIHSMIHGVLMRRRLDAPGTRCNRLILSNRRRRGLGSGSSGRRFDTFASSTRRHCLIAEFLAGSSLIGSTTSGSLTRCVGAHVSLFVFGWGATFRTSRSSRYIDDRRERCDDGRFALGG